MAVVGGIKRFSVDGVSLDVVEWGSMSVLNAKNETVEVVAGTPGTKILQRIPHCECTISTSGIKISDYAGQQGVTPQVDLQNGRSYAWPNAAEVSDGGEVDVMDGKMTLKWESPECKEI